MATRKCGNIYFPKYFMAVRPFFTRHFSRIIWVGAVKKFPSKMSSDAQSENLEPSYDPRVFFKKKILVLYAAYGYPFWVVSL